MLILASLLVGGIFMYRGWIAFSEGRPLWRIKQDALLEYRTKTGVRVMGLICFSAGLLPVIAAVFLALNIAQVAFLLWLAAIGMGFILGILYYLPL